MNIKKSKKPLKETLYDRIESEKVCPKPKVFFQSKECVVWFLWAISVVLGAISVAVSLFVVTHSQYAFYEATHENFLTFIAETLPYVWFVVFGIMAYLAIYNIRHTAHGYKYPAWVIVSSSLVLSFVGGSALQFFGLGYTADDMLGKNVEMYMSQQKLEEHMWQEPSDGRLLGRQVLSTVTPTSTVIFEDQNGKRWRLEVNELKPFEIELLSSEKSVKLLGKMMNQEMYIFHACGVFPWMMDKNVSIKNLSDEKDNFVKRVYEHMQKVEDIFEQDAEGVLGRRELSKTSVCSEMSVIKRMPSDKLHKG